MGYNVKACSGDTKRNTGKSACIDTLGAHVKVLLTEPDFEIDTLTNAKNVETWETAIQERKVFPLWDVYGFENQSEDDGVFESTTGLRRIPTSQGNYRFEYHFAPPVYNMVGGFSFHGKSMRIVIIDGNGKVIGTSEDGTKFRGFICNRVEVKKIIQAENKDEVARLPMVFDLSTSNEYKEGLATFEADFMSELSGLHDVDVTLVGSAPATSDDSVVVKVTRSSDDSGIVGLVAPDFQVTKDGDAVTIDTAVANTSVAGQYTITLDSALFEAGDYVVDLLQPDDMTTKGYDSRTAVEFTTE